MSRRGPRVVWVLDAPSYGGAEHYATRCAAGLGVDAWFAVSEPVPPRLRAVLADTGLGQRLVPVPAVRGKGDLPAFVRLAARLRRLRPDLVHVNANAPGNVRFGLAAALLGARAPVVLTVHTAVPLLSAAQRRVLGVLYRRCAAVVAVSEEIASQLAGGLGVDRARLHVVRNGVAVPAEPVRPVPSPVLRVGALGRLTRQKGFDVLVDAVRLLADDGVPVRVTVGGEGPESADLARRAAGLPVELLGEVDDVGAWLAGLDLVVLPSRYEGLPFVLLEAMAAGVPVVATDVGDVRDAVDGTVALVPPEDPAALAAAIRGLADPGRRAEAARAARRRAVDALSEEGMLTATAQVYAAAGRPVTPRSAGSPAGRGG